VLQDVRNLCSPGKLNAEIKELELLTSYAKVLSTKFDQQSPFSIMTDQFCQFFNAEIKMQLLASAIELNDSFQKISGFLS